MSVRLSSAAMSAVQGRSSTTTLPGGGGGGGTPTNFVSLRPVEVPPMLQAGEKFIKWDEVNIPPPTTKKCILF